MSDQTAGCDEAEMLLRTEVGDLYLGHSGLLEREADTTPDDEISAFDVNSRSFSFSFSYSRLILCSKNGFPPSRNRSLLFVYP